MLDGVRIESAASGFGFSHVMYSGGGAEERECTCSEDSRVKESSAIGLIVNFPLFFFR